MWHASLQTFFPWLPGSTTFNIVLLAWLLLSLLCSFPSSISLFKYCVVSQVQSLVFPSTQWFLSFGTIDIWAQMILCCMHCRIYSIIFDFYPLNISSNIFPSFENQKCFQTLSNTSGWSGELPLAENHCSSSLGNSPLNILDFSDLFQALGFKYYLYANDI